MFHDLELQTEKQSNNKKNKIQINYCAILAEIL